MGRLAGMVGRASVLGEKNLKLLQSPCYRVGGPSKRADRQVVSGKRLEQTCIGLYLRESLVNNVSNSYRRERPWQP